MNNFLFENKTKVYFGKGGVKEYLGCLLEHYGDTVMLAYGGGSIKHNGIYPRRSKSPLFPAQTVAWTLAQSARPGAVMTTL